MDSTIHDGDIELERRIGFRRAATALPTEADHRAQDAERRRLALRAWITQRLAEEARLAARLGEQVPSVRASEATGALVRELAGVVVAHSGLSTDLHGDGAGGVVLVADHLAAGRRIIVECNDQGPCRLARVTLARVDDVAAPITTRVLVDALAWLSR